MHFMRMSKILGSHLHEELRLSSWNDLSYDSIFFLKNVLLYGKFLENLFFANLKI